MVCLYSVHGEILKSIKLNLEAAHHSSVMFFIHTLVIWKSKIGYKIIKLNFCQNTV